MDPALPGAGLGDYELKLFTTPNRMQNVCHTNVLHRNPSQESQRWTRSSGGVCPDTLRCLSTYGSVSEGNGLTDPVRETLRRERSCLKCTNNWSDLWIGTLGLGGGGGGGTLNAGAPWEAGPEDQRMPALRSLKGPGGRKKMLKAS